MNTDTLYTPSVNSLLTISLKELADIREKIAITCDAGVAVVEIGALEVKALVRATQFDEARELLADLQQYLHEIDMPAPAEAPEAKA
jgi:hypothetical protein